MTPEQRALNARIAVYSMWAKCPDRVARLQPARDGFEKRFADEVDPERKLTEDERARRIEFAKKAYYTKLAKLSAERRAQRAKRRQAS